MPNHSSLVKAGRQSGGRASQDVSASRSAAIAPPRYGIEFVDNGSIPVAGHDREDPGRPGTGATVELPLRGVVHPVAEALARPDVRFRLPTFNRLKDAYTDKALSIPESVIKDRVAQLLGRMQKEGRLKTKDDVPTIIGKIFPSPGTINETEFNNAVDVKERSVIYQSVLEANTTVTKADTPKLRTAMSDADKLIEAAEKDAAELTAVFGSKDADAKANYGKARKAIDEVSKDMATHITTDYNLDDPEVFLGGWASFGARHMHLLAGIVQVTDPIETKATIIHEASHLADSSIDDHGYYGTPGFEAMSEADKLGNAGHYEEIPRRIMKKSSFVGVTFTPGVKKGGAKVTREDQVNRSASEYLRQAWDAAVDTHTLIRGVRKAKLSGDDKPFTNNKVVLLELSKLMDLTIHEQTLKNAVVTDLDVTLSESIAHGVGVVGQLADSIPFPNPVGALTDTELRDKIVAAAAAKYGRLLKNATRDKALLDWFVAHYRKVPSP